MPVRYHRDKDAHPHFIREWRKFRGMKLADLAGMTNMSVASLSRLELGKQSYTQPVLEELAEALGCTPADLIARAPESASQEIMDMLMRLNPKDLATVLRMIKAAVGTE